MKNPRHPIKFDKEALNLMFELMSKGPDRDRLFEMVNSLKDQPNWIEFYWCSSCGSGPFYRTDNSPYFCKTCDYEISDVASEILTKCQFCLTISDRVCENREEFEKYCRKLY